jgi:hypothetical protein
MPAKRRIAVAGAGIYGSAIAIRLARSGHSVTLYDPLGVMCAASVINQFRVHRGYHYPRSSETIAEILEARREFIDEYKEAIVDFVDEYKGAIVQSTENYYAIPYEGSKTTPAAYEATMEAYGLPLRRARPEWIDFDFIDRCYAAEESFYDPEALRALLEETMTGLDIKFIRDKFVDEFKDDFDFVVFATYGTSGSHMYLFGKVLIQVAEKILIKLPAELRRKSLVVVDGPFTAFDPYGNTEYSQFGSALHTNHWVTKDPAEPIPDQYARILNAPEFAPVEFTHFDRMLNDAVKSVPLCARAEYIGSKLTLRLVEDNPYEDRRILNIGQSDDKTFHVFSGKVVSAVKAARIVDERIASA